MLHKKLHDEERVVIVQNYTEQIIAAFERHKKRQSRKTAFFIMISQKLIQAFPTLPLLRERVFGWFPALLSLLC